MEDYYSVLGVAPTASSEEIIKRYRFLALAYHPDRFSSAESKEEAGREMARINAAYQVLSDPLKRAAYDRKREGNATAGGSTTTGTSGNDQASSQPYNRIDEAFRYFELLIKRWGAYIQLSDQDTRLKQAVQEFVLTARMISTRLSGHLGKQGVQLFLEEFDEGLLATVLINVALGIELSAAPPPIGFDRTSLGDYSGIPIRTQLNSVIDYGLTQGVFSSSEVSELKHRITIQLREVYQSGQQVGKERAVKLRTGSTQTSQQETRTGQSRQSQPLFQYCQSCGAIAETKHMTFRRMIGYFIFAQFRTVKGEMCVQCAARYFWEFSGITLLFGWLWLGGILAPLFFLANWFNYGKNKELRDKVGHFENPAPGWKAVTIIIILALLIVGLSSLFSNPSGLSTIQVSNNSYLDDTSVINKPVLSPTATKDQAVVPKPTAISRPTAASTMCKKWNSVTQSDKGDRICVYGVVEKAYWGDEQRFFITFSDRKTDFRFIVLGGYYFDDIVGYCVEATGVIKGYDDVLYMELGERLTYYDTPGMCPYY